MAPEFPPRLVVLTLESAGDSVAALMENVELNQASLADARRLRVKWSELTPPAGYRAVGSGALFVEEAPGVVFTEERPVPLHRLEGQRFRWVQGTPPDVPWVMIAFVFPVGYSLRRARPAPTAAKTVEQRVAVYWCLRGDDLGRTSVEWDLHRLDGDLGSEVRYLNSHSSLDDVPSAAGIEIDSTAAYPVRAVKVFLCHSSTNKSVVRTLHARLEEAGFAPWLDEKDILPGEDWERAIAAAVSASDVVLVCLSKDSVSRVGFLQRELTSALNAAEEQPEGAIFIIPLKLEACDVPERLKRWQWLDYFEDGAHERLLLALRKRASQLHAK